jgi:DNA-binding response OmpR family regulator
MTFSAPPGAQILLVDDDPAMLGALRDLLEAAGYGITTAMSAQEATEALARQRPDLIILDLILPDTDGLVLVGALRARYDVPVIVCSGTARQRDSTLARMLGADDFLAKPVEPEDVLARITAVLRRAREATPPSATEVGPTTSPAAPPGHDGDGTERALTPTEFRLLDALVARSNQVVSREEIADLLWGAKATHDLRTVDTYVYRLRSKLEQAPASGPVIVAVRGMGYVLLDGPHPRAPQ